MKIKIEKTSFCGIACLLVNNKYLIYLDNGVIYNILDNREIPQYVFKIKNKYIKL